jgi:type IV secretion system protein VirB8
MTEPETNPREAYYSASESWSDSQNREITASRRVAWIVAGVLGAIALFEAIALIALMPLKTVVPYTLLVDKQTGYVEALKPLEQKTITPDSALVRSFLVQYVIARESFDARAMSQPPKHPTPKVRWQPCRAALSSR